MSVLNIVISDNENHPGFEVHNKNEIERHGRIVGYIEYYEHWKRRVFLPCQSERIFSADALREIADFLDKG